jgi:hypothetical protein
VLRRVLAALVRPSTAADLSAAAQRADVSDHVAALVDSDGFAVVNPPGPGSSQHSDRAAHPGLRHLDRTFAAVPR